LVAFLNGCMSERNLTEEFQQARSYYVLLELVDIHMGSGKYPLKKYSKSEIRSIFGSPDDDWRTTKESWVYYSLRHVSGSYLHFHFDDNEKLKSYDWASE